MNLLPYIPLVLLAGLTALGFAIQIFPEIDLAASGLFYTRNLGFTLSTHPILDALHEFATTGSRMLGAALCALLLVSLIRKKTMKVPAQAWLMNVPPKTWLFLLCLLVIGPGLVANAMLKDHWGRARPREVANFGGSKTFTATLIPQPNARANGSFVAGDAAFGFFLPAFALLCPLPPEEKKAAQPEQRHRRPWGRIVFWAGTGMGWVFGFTRIAMGAHFLSDVIFAMLAMLAVMALLQIAFYGQRTTRRYWRYWFLPDRNSASDSTGLRAP